MSFILYGCAVVFHDHVVHADDHLEKYLVWTWSEARRKLNDMFFKVANPVVLSEIVNRSASDVSHQRLCFRFIGCTMSNPHQGSYILRFCRLCRVRCIAAVGNGCDSLILGLGNYQGRRGQSHDGVGGW
jgi:hypothetical protein